MENDPIKTSIEETKRILHHWTNLPLDGQPPYSPLPEETVWLLKEQLKRLNKSLAETNKVREKDFNLAGLKKYDE